MTGAVPTAPQVAPPVVEENPKKPKYIIEEGLESKYANIYSLIAAIEFLEDEYCNGNVSTTERAQIFKDLSRQFTTVQQALGLNKKDVENFCTAAGLAHGYAISALFNQAADVDTDPAKIDKIREGVHLGQDFTTLSDWCFVKTGDAQSLLSLVRQIKGRLEALHILQRNAEVREMTDKWMNTLNELPLKLPVPPELLDELQKDLDLWRIAVHETLQ